MSEVPQWTGTSHTYQAFEYTSHWLHLVESHNFDIGCFVLEFRGKSHQRVAITLQSIYKF